MALLIPPPIQIVSEPSVPSRDLWVKCLRGSNDDIKEQLVVLSDLDASGRSIPNTSSPRLRVAVQNERALLPSEISEHVQRLTPLLQSRDGGILELLVLDLSRLQFHAPPPSLAALGQECTMLFLRALIDTAETLYVILPREPSFVASVRLGKTPLADLNCILQEAQLKLVALALNVSDAFLEQAMVPSERGAGETPQAQPFHADSPNRIPSPDPALLYYTDSDNGDGSHSDDDDSHLSSASPSLPPFDMPFRALLHEEYTYCSFKPSPAVFDALFLQVIAASHCWQQGSLFLHFPSETQQPEKQICLLLALLNFLGDRYDTDGPKEEFPALHTTLISNLPPHLTATEPTYRRDRPIAIYDTQLVLEVTFGTRRFRESQHHVLSRDVDRELRDEWGIRTRRFRVLLPGTHSSLVPWTIRQLKWVGFAQTHRPFTNPAAMVHQQIHGSDFSPRPKRPKRQEDHTTTRSMPPKLRWKKGVM